MKNKKFRLIQNLVVLALIGVGVYSIYRFFIVEETPEYTIENTPIKVELVRSIAEIATVSYKDEVVRDTIEFYKTAGEQFQGNVEKIADLDFWKYGLRASNIKRRLTLIVRGEVRYGFNLTDKKIKISHNSDTIWINMPKPEILDVLVVPSKTEVFQENGDWKDYERKKLEKGAIKELENSANALNLNEKAENQMKTLLRALIPDEKKLIIYFE